MGLARYSRDPTTRRYQRHGAGGRYWRITGATPPNCCTCGSTGSGSAPNDCVACAINTWTVTFAGVSFDAGCRTTPFGSTKILTCPINGTFTLTYANPEFRGANGGLNTPSVCIWYARLPGSFAIYNEPTCTTVYKKVCNDGWITLSLKNGFWAVNAWLGAEGDGQTSFGAIPWLDMWCFCAKEGGPNPNSGFEELATVALFTAGGGPVVLPGIGGPGNCGGFDCKNTFTLNNLITDHDGTLNNDGCDWIDCGVGFDYTGGLAFTFGWGGTVVCTPH